MATKQLTEQDQASEAWCIVGDAIMDLGKAESVLNLAIVDLNRHNIPLAGATALARDTVSRIARNLATVERLLGDLLGARKEAA